MHGDIFSQDVPSGYRTRVNPPLSARFPRGARHLRRTGGLSDHSPACHFDRESVPPSPLSFRPSVASGEISCRETPSTPRTRWRLCRIWPVSAPPTRVSIPMLSAALPVSAPLEDICDRDARSCRGMVIAKSSRTARPVDAGRFRRLIHSGHSDVLWCSLPGCTWPFHQPSNGSCRRRVGTKFLIPNS